MEIAIHAAEPDDAAVLGSLLQLYLHDFSEVDGHDVDDSGRFAYDGLARGGEVDRWRDACLIYASIGRLADARSARRPALGPGACWSIAEFFVMRKYRRRGVGARVAAEVFRRFPGRWEVSPVAANAAAQSFRRAAVGRYTVGRYSLETFVIGDGWRGPVQVFTSGPDAPG